MISSTSRLSWNSRRGESLGVALARHRSEIATEILYWNSSSRARTVGADLFVDALLEQLIAAETDSGSDAFIEWIAAYFRNQANPAVPAEIARHVFDAITAVFAHHGTLGSEEFARINDLDRKLKPLLAHRTEKPGQDANALDDVDGALNALISQLDERDPFSAEHSRAVAGWCSRIARALGLDADAALYLSRCGLLHDIGKVETPAGILNAPRALTSSEWRIMRTHVIAGERLAAEVELLHPFLPAVRNHHERFKGGGYPDDLRGEQIPFSARVVSVADAFNAMIGRRPYRPPLSPSLALAELIRHRGLQFDPDIVDAMHDVVLRGRGSL
jgi:putative nucleotidyltransferase with HDIG domain